MNKKRILQNRILQVACLTFLVMVSMPVFATDGISGTWDLPQCISYALSHNLTIKNSRLQARLADLSRAQSQRELWPGFNAGASYSINSGTTVGSGRYSLNGQLTLVDAQQWYTLAQQKLAAQTGALGVTETEQTVTLAITQAYLQVLYCRETLSRAIQTLATSQQQLDVQTARYAAGAVAENDVAQVEAQYSQDHYAQVLAQNSLDKQVLSLRQLLELAAGESFQPLYPDIDDQTILAALPARDSVVAAALKARPEIEAAAQAVRAGRLAYAKARAGWLPTLNLGGSVSTGTVSTSTNDFLAQTADNGSAALQLSLSVPLWDQGKTLTATAQAAIAVQQAELAYTQVRLQLTATVENAYGDALAARGRLTAAQTQLTTAPKSSRLAAEQYRHGMVTTLELLTEQNNLAAAEAEYLNAKYVALFSMKILDYYGGKSITL
jgi:outer membrane protein